MDLTPILDFGNFATVTVPGYSPDPARPWLPKAGWGSRLGVERFVPLGHDGVRCVLHHTSSEIRPKTSYSRRMR